MRYRTVAALAAAFFSVTPASAQDGPSSAPTDDHVAVSPPPVDDPMLAPVPPPKRLFSSWREIADWLSASSPDLRIAVDQVLQAEALTRGALARYLPTITATVRYTHQFLTRNNATAVPVATPLGDITAATTAPLPNVWDGSLRLQQNILDVAALDQIGVNRVGEDASRLALEDKKRTLSLVVAQDVVAVVTAEKAAEVVRVGLRAALEEDSLIRRRVELRAGTEIDLMRADQNVAMARSELVTGDETLHVAREALAVALGIPEEAGVTPGVEVNGITDAALASCRAVDSVEQRPDIASARKSLEVAKRELRNVSFAFLPTVTAQSALNETSAVGIGYPNPTWNISALLTMPIWDGGTRYANLRSARAVEDIAVQELEVVRTAALIQIEQAQRGVRVAQTADDVARQERDIAARNEQLVNLAYVGGAATSLELVTASEAHREAELNLVVADFAVVKARLTAVLVLSSCPL
jgi:outer membrane protein TolC